MKRLIDGEPATVCDYCGYDQFDTSDDTVTCGACGEPAELVQ